MATGKTGGGSAYDVTPPGNALLGAEKAAQARQDAGKNPTVSPVHAAVKAANAILHGTQTPAQAAKQAKAFGGQKPTGDPAFTPLTFGVNALLHLPQIIGGAHQQAVQLAHPSAANPPSLHREITALLSGAVGLPRQGVNDRFDPTKGVSTGEVPKVPKGKTTEATGGDLGRQVREGLKGAQGARVAQDKLYARERGVRAGAAAEAMQQGGKAGYEAALGKLKGELPKLTFNGLQNFDQAGLDSLYTHIQEHPTLRTYEKIRGQQALTNVVNGKVPTRSELGLLKQVFGREVSNQIVASIPAAAKAKELGLQLWNVPRSLMASMDLSAPFRQGLVSGAAHPAMFFRNFAPMVKAFGSENVYRNIIEDIHSRPTFPLMEKAGVAFTDLGSLQSREEQFMGGDLAERIPIVGHGVRASGRAYTGFLDKMRADMFDHYIQQAEQSGIDTHDPKMLKSLGGFINSATGRGDLGALQKHAVTLNSLFFSPRLLFSRLNFLNPLWYARLDPFARRQALLAARNLVGTVGLTLYLAKLGGAQVNSDPRNADFGKIKFGDTRIDILGGFQQPVRLLAQLFSGTIISSTTGKTLHLGPQGPGKLSRYDIAMRFVTQKLAPSPALIVSWFKGTDFADKPFSWKKAAVQDMIPLLAQDAYDIQHQYHNPGLTVGGYGLGAFGIGLQTYTPKAAKPKAGSGGYDQGSVYDQGYGGGGSVYDQPASP